VRSLKRDGLRYGTIVLEELTSDAFIDDREKWWIAFARAWGCSLTNLTDGGDGASGYRRSPELLAMDTERARSKALDPEYRRRLSEAIKLYWSQVDPEIRRQRAIRASHSRDAKTWVKLSVATKSNMTNERAKAAGKFLTPDVQRRASAMGAMARRGTHLTTEQRLHLSDIKRGEKRPAWVIEKIVSAKAARSIARSWGCAI
jgi:hypothetical protein